MSRKKRRKKARKVGSRLTPEERVLQSLSDGCWWDADHLQRKSSVKKVVINRVLSHDTIDTHVYKENSYHILLDESAKVTDIYHLDAFVRSFATDSVGHIVGTQELHRIFSGFARSVGIRPLELDAFRDELRMDKRIAYNAERDVFYGIHVA